MKYLPTLDLWNPAIASAVRSGQIRLQVGQWIKCGSDKPSRYVRNSGNSIWAVHPEGAPQVSIPQARFSYLSKVWRNQPVSPELRQRAGY